jgi:hypothetical protein
VIIIILKKRILKNVPYISEEVFITGIFVVVLDSLIAFPTSNIASVFATGETQQLWQPDIKASDIYQYYPMVLGKDQEPSNSNSKLRT